LRPRLARLVFGGASLSRRFGLLGCTGSLIAAGRELAWVLAGVMLL
jgi:hypothetical protein